MTSKRKNCIVTGTRSEYGLLYWLMKEVAADPDLELQIIATGMHLSLDYKLSSRDIEADGFPVSDQVEMLSSTSEVGVSKSVCVGLWARPTTWHAGPPA